VSTPDTYARKAGTGWITFAGVMIMIAGVLNFFYGIEAIDNSSFFTDSGNYVVFNDLNTWGWIHLIVGIVQFFAAFGIWNRSGWGVWVGLLTAGINAVLVLFWITAFPFGALAIFGIDLLIIYGLSAYGFERD
jgi:hypothetical protein